MIVKSEIKYITIACCTYKRPIQLERLLNSLTTLNLPADIKTEVIIVDNDSEKSAEEITKKFKESLNIHYVVQSQKGLANVRNKALETAIELGATHLAFVDDDEIVDANWLMAHVDLYNRFENIYISNGPVYSKFENKYPNYITNNNIFKAYSNKKLGKIKTTCPSNNVFLPLNIIKENNIYFSQEFNSSGGEDTDFFTRLTLAGFNIGWNYNAIIYEIVDNNRTNLKWILHRAFYNGSTSAYLKIKNNKNLSLYIMSKSINLLFNSVLAVFSICLGLTCFVNRLIDISANIGNICGAVTLNLTKSYDK